MSRRSLAGKRILLTGASAGIGRALAHELAGRGASLLICARRAERLQSLAEELRATAPDISIRCLPGDVTDAANRRDWIDAAREFGGLDVLMNNAGSGAYGRFDAADEARLRRLFEVNFFAPAELMRETLPLLRASAAAGRRPLIVNVSSVLAHRAAPLKSEYSAAKFALHGLSDAVRAELTRDGIDLLLVSPSTTATEFSQQATAAGENPPPTYGKPATPEHVARRAVRAMETGRHEVMIGRGAKWLILLDRLVPRWADKLTAKYGMK
jgi:short-subunit dehydrogenase